MGRWIQSFLIQRQQRVVVNKRMSKISMLKSGVPQDSVLGPVLFLIYICDIGKDLTASTLVYVDDTKIKKTVRTEEDVEDLQLELEKLNIWSEKNNMEFNQKKFQVIRYGENEDLKNETCYFAGNYDEVIKRFNSLRDLGVQLQDDGKFDEHIEHVCNKSRKKCGWLLRTFNSRNTQFMKQMFKSLVQPHADYCSVLWMPQEGCSLDKVEKELWWLRYWLEATEAANELNAATP